MTRFLLTSLIASCFVFALSTTACSDSETEVLECTGECSCDEDENSCTCTGGTDCAIEGEVGITFYCDGNAACDLQCGTECHVVCPGTTGCTATLGDNSTAECQGTASCNYNCEGDCDISCGGNTNCTVECADGCELEGTTCQC